MSRFIATISSSVVSGRSTAASIRLRVPRWSIASTANVPASGGDRVESGFRHGVASLARGRAWPAETVSVTGRKYAAGGRRSLLMESPWVAAHRP